MKKLILILCLGLMAQGCSTIGAAAKGFGDGVGSVYQNSPKQSYNCVSRQDIFGQITSTCN